ncbi:cytochrome o ubiquinol oxidase operon protein cyoD [Paracoccus isoporae]|uniref:Cytochrome bo(3) ubiquinol oxidase subunit 4 n=1 Tax=Paracoccus isoporae TaxID=591205 RepID=A0A1G6UL68_9RHOB|nr:cytochrome o ubiquinol oxidase subunit IV [Paracoccus isoporae]SDD42021.1 cytochrome o ubiquinol oxidase operon protein cyoD [Paracoccus isoporae]
MSASSNHHGDHEAAQFPHGTKRDYVTGFVLSVILTVIPFSLVMSGGLDSARMTGFVILACAVVQMVVHMIYFLHMTPKAESGWTLISLAFTLILLTITVVGTIWVMYNMDANMMPGMGTDAQSESPSP